MTSCVVAWVRACAWLCCSSFRADPDSFLFFTFEEMKRDPVAVIRRIADFVGLPYDQQLLDTVRALAAALTPRTVLPHARPVQQ